MIDVDFRVSPGWTWSLGERVQSYIMDDEQSLTRWKIPCSRRLVSLIGFGFVTTLHILTPANFSPLINSAHGRSTSGMSINNLVFFWWKQLSVGIGIWKGQNRHVAEDNCVVCFHDLRAPTLMMPIIRFVMPSLNKQLKKLLDFIGKYVRSTTRTTNHSNAVCNDLVCSFLLRPCLEDQRICSNTQMNKFLGEGPNSSKRLQGIPNY